MEFEMTKFELAVTNCFPIPTELILNFSAVLTLKIVLDYAVYDSVTYYIIVSGNYYSSEW